VLDSPRTFGRVLTIAKKPVFYWLSWMARWWAGSGTSVPFPTARCGFSVVGEQFWGRAARASADSQESGRLFNFVDTRRSIPASPYSAAPILPYCTSSMTCAECVSEPEFEVAVTVTG
jgi:hypothetical protein